MMDTLSRKRKIDCDGITPDTTVCDSYSNTTRAFNAVHGDSVDDWSALQAILETYILQGDRIHTPDAAYAHLVRWFRVIALDTEKLHTFRQWISISPRVKQELGTNAECNANVVTIAPTPSSTTSSSASSSASLAHLLADEPSSVDATGENAGDSHARSTGGSSTGRFIPDSNLLHTFYKSSPGSPAISQEQSLLQRLVQQQQQQIALLQQQQKQSSSAPSLDIASKVATIGISPRTGSAGTVMTVTLKGALWHARSPQCSCSLGFTTTSGNTMTSQRIPGGSHGEFLFTVPQLNTSSPHAPLVVHLSLCSSLKTPIVCLESFYCNRDRALKNSITSDEDSEEMFSEETGSTEDEVGSPPPQALPPFDVPPNSICPTPKQMMSIRERMLELVQRGTRSAAQVVVLQQPSVRVVWKNRRLDVPFKLRVECLEDASLANSITPSKLIMLAVVADHKGRLQIDAAENYAEEPSSQGLVNFSNLRMTKGTWGKEWTITFAAVIKASLNNPVIAGVSASCPIVVKTRKNPQVRHSNRGVEASPPKSPPHFTFVERKGSESPVPLKRHRVEDILNCPPTLPPIQPQRPSHSEDMASLLAAAEMKHQEQLQEGHEDAPSLPVMAKQSESEHSFANFQSLLGYLEDVRQKRQVSLAIFEQPQPKRDSKVLIVKKGKPFRTPFQVQLHSTALRHNPQNYVCVAVVRNDKGEEVAVRNNEVPFDWRGVACFAGLMVMKGTWGKTVQLTFEAKWATKRGDKTAPWASHTRMLVVSETSPTQLMCYTKDKKAPGAA